MSNCVNVVHLMGTAGKDPEIRATSGGTVIANFSLATSEGRKDAQGNWNDETTWHNIKAFGKTAEAIRERVTKGTKVFIEGKLKTESWEDKQTGQKRYKTVVIATYASLVPTARSCGGRTEAKSDTQHPNSNDAVLQSAEITDEDIPF